MRKQQGFTLVEMLVVVVLLAITVGVTSDILMSLVRSNTKTQVLNEIEQQANFITLKIEKELRDALTASVGADFQSISFQNRDKETIIYQCLDCGSGGTAGRIQRSIDGGSTYFDVTSNVNPGGVDVVCTYCFEITGSNPQVVKINMEFRQAQQGAGVSYSGSSKIESSIVIRSSY